MSFAPVTAPFRRQKSLPFVKYCALNKPSELFPELKDTKFLSCKFN